MSQEEIKLGWYRCKTNGRFFRVVFISSDFSPPIIGGWEGRQLVDQYSTEYFQAVFDYIGPELGEWVSPDDVKLSELPIKARFRNTDVGDWIEGLLDGRFVGECHLSYSRRGGHWHRYCQVWRAKK